eukprot:TRINITY_DN15397_c0_g1_i2.p2 TRINITY_DN15397_c0_g1~~TRINITY_DN15397_c0_g1_i2.p2  ORF type:complete len:310 (-),score=69.86 TRINITY_DN15397_c0_g1_i2:79-1008(-)
MDNPLRWALAIVALAGAAACAAPEQLRVPIFLGGALLLGYVLCSAFRRAPAPAAASHDAVVAGERPGSEILLAAESRRKDGVQHVFFDFDLTISSIHMFKQLANWEPGVPPPHAFNERGQIARIADLNQSGKYKYNAARGCVEKVQQDGGSWSEAALGGPERKELLRKLFVELRAAGVRLTVITKGNAGAVQALLDKEGLLSFFVTVYGMVKDAYGTSDYDTRCPKSQYEARDEQELRSAKVELIKELMSKENLSCEEAILVEDDLAEIESVRGVCRKVYVQGRRGGMTSVEMDMIREMAGLIATADRG